MCPRQGADDVGEAPQHEFFFEQVYRAAFGLGLCMWKAVESGLAVRTSYI